ncbi:DUF1947 domain-containing protein [Candidatus Woesearchaeota archaeon]|nr:DUF1947 domain-containing protein [Candidatus Woesearchaeota archaeon]
MKKSMKNKEVRILSAEVFGLYGIELSKKDKYETDERIVLINNEPMFFHSEGKIIPTLKMLLKHGCLRKITVDMGAVPFVVKGADIMRPGIVGIQEGIQKGEVVVIVDEKHSKPLGIGQAMFSAEDMEKLDKGKVIRALHYVGDEIWNYANS